MKVARGLVLTLLVLTSARLAAAGGALPSCAAWASTQEGKNLPRVPGPRGAQRKALLADGGGLVPIDDRYYAAWFAPGFADAPSKRILVALHGTDGMPEFEWNGWKEPLASRGWGFIGLSYLDPASGNYTDDTTIYRQLTQAIHEVGASCNAAGARFFLLGFSRGSARSFPVTYLDRKAHAWFTATVANSGSWRLKGRLPEILAGIAERDEKTAFAGARFWMYCGEKDRELGFPMCEGMEQARDFVRAHGGQVDALYKDAAGGHGDLVRSAAATRAMFEYLESLP